MPDDLKKFLNRELDEIKRNKIRVGLIVVGVVVLIGVWLFEDAPRGEEITLNETPVTKDLPVKPLPVTKDPYGVTLVIGANADALFVADPFAVKEKPAPPPKAVVPEIPIQPPIIPPHEKILLTGVAISGDNKTAMFLRGNETIFLTVGDELCGKIISDITPDFVLFADGSRVFVQKEVN